MERPTWMRDLIRDLARGVADAACRGSDAELLAASDALTRMVLEATKHLETNDHSYADAAAAAAGAPSYQELEHQLEQVRLQDAALVKRNQELTDLTDGQAGLVRELLGRLGEGPNAHLYCEHGLRSDDGTHPNHRQTPVDPKGRVCRLGWPLP